MKKKIAEKLHRELIERIAMNVIRDLASRGKPALATTKFLVDFLKEEK